MELLGHLHSNNPEASINFLLASQVTSKDLINHIVLLGGIAWNDVTRRLNASVGLPVRQVPNEKIYTGEVFEIVGGQNQGQQFMPRCQDGNPGTEENPGVLLEDVAMLARLPNPFNTLRTLTYCNGIHSRGVLGAVRCLTDPAVRDDNESYLEETFFDTDHFAILTSPGARRRDHKPEPQKSWRGFVSVAGGRIEIRVTSDWVPEQSASHDWLLDSSRQSSAAPVRCDRGADQPTGRSAQRLHGLALETEIPLIVVCSKRVHKHQVIDMAAERNVKAYALDLPPHPANPLGISFTTSSDEELAAASSVRTRDLSMKRNLGLVLARMLGWQRLMFLDDDIYDVTEEDVDALAAGLSDHSVSVLIPDEYPDNSVACHAHRLGGGYQGKFASAGGMGVRCDRDDLAFFPNIYNEDWFFFSEEAASRKITQVGESRQGEYDPYEDPQRAVKEEFGDLLAEGLYARLDHGQGMHGVDTAYWEAFIKNRRVPCSVAESLRRHPERERHEDRPGSPRRRGIHSCRPGSAGPDSIDSAFRHLNLDYAESPSPSTLCRSRLPSPYLLESYPHSGGWPQNPHGSRLVDI